MSERVVINRDFAFHSEFLVKIRLSDFDLPDEAFARRHKTVGLKVPPARNDPFARFYERFYTREKSGIVFFDLFVQKRFVMTENVIEFVRKIRRAFERGKSG